MSRNPKIEAILEAWLELELCDPPHKFQSLSKLNELLDEAIAKQPISRTQILDCLFPQFKELKAQRRREAKVAVAQSSGKK